MASSFQTPAAGGSAYNPNGTSSPTGTPLSGANPRIGGNTAATDYQNTPLNTVAGNPPPTQSPTNAGFNYFALNPAQQQAYSNGVPISQLGSIGQTPTSASQGFNPTFINVPFGSGTSTVLSPQSMAQQLQMYQNSPFMTPAAIANQNVVSAAGDPMNGQMVNINGQMVPWNSLSQEQGTMYQYFMGTGQNLPANFLNTYQGQNTPANASYNQYFNNPANQAAINASRQPVSTSASSLLAGNTYPTTPYGAQGTLSQLASQPQSGQNFQQYIQGLLQQALYGASPNNPANYSVATTPLGYTQYQNNTPQNSNTDINAIMPFLASLMMSYFGNPQQASTGGAALGR